MRNVPRRPLLLSLLAVIGGAGCGPDHEKDVSYVAGEQQLPLLPCLPKSDVRLRVLNPSCTNDFEVTAGPTQSTNVEGKAICVYHIEYGDNDNCANGRPIRRGAVAVVALLRSTHAWS